MGALKNMCIDDDENQQYNATCFYFSYVPRTLNKEIHYLVLSRVLNYMLQLWDQILLVT